MDFSCPVCKMHTDQHLPGLLWRLNELTSLRTGRAQSPTRGPRVPASPVAMPGACPPRRGLKGRENTGVPGGMCPFLPAPKHPSPVSNLVLTFQFPQYNFSGQTPYWAHQLLMNNSKGPPTHMGVGSMTKCGPGFNPKQPKWRSGIEIQA